MADEGNEDSWLYGNTNADGKNGEKGGEPAADGDDGGKDGTSMDGGAAVQWEMEEPNRANKRPRSSFSDEEQHHDDNAMDSSDLGQSRGDSTRREEDLHGEEDSHLDQEDESHDQPRTDKPERSDGEMDTDDSDDDDDINVVIGDIKSGPSYNIIKQRGPIVPPQVAQAVPGQDKAKQPAGKFSIEEFESVGTINGVPAHEFSIDSLEEKPWRKPGADITDYFNYGFNEETWRAYCERQKRMRMHESGVGLQGLTINNPQAAQTQNQWRQGPPPPRKMNNGIDVIGGMSMHPRPDQDMMPRHPKENIIQVMTADRREYSRTASKFDSAMGPPPFGAPPEFYHNEPDYGDYGYEPTQESQWNQEPNWQPHGIKTLTPGPPPQMLPPGMGMPPPHMDMMPPPGMPGMGMGPPGMGPPGMRGHDRERDRDRDRSERDRERERSGRPPRDREREREHRRERERDREREASISKPEVVEVERSRSEKPERERDAEKEKRSSKSDRHKDRYRERSRSREKSKARRRSRSRERERHSSRSEKKKSHRKDKEESE